MTINEIVLTLAAAGCAIEWDGGWSVLIGDRWIRLDDDTAVNVPVDTTVPDLIAA